MSKYSTLLGLTFFAGTILASSCAVQNEIETQPTFPLSYYENIVKSPSRLVADFKTDAARKPAEVLQFSRVAKGEIVVEIEAGRGYYTDLLSQSVGVSGKVHMINPPFFDTFIPEADLEKRLGKAGKRLPNVVLHRATPFDDLPLSDSSADLVTWILGPHEVFFKPEGGYSFGDPEKTYQEIARVLKRGGRLLMIDHSAAAGAPTSVGGTLHRIDPAQVEQLAYSQGFTLEAKSDILRNVEDDHSLNVFDPKIRRQTDRFTHLYVKQ